MKYKIQILHLKTGKTDYLFKSPKDSVESLSASIKVAFSLPYTDYGVHRFYAHGATYVVANRVETEAWNLAEWGLRPGVYKCSEDISIREIFTSAGSAITYEQSGILIRCTFVGRER